MNVSVETTSPGAFERPDEASFNRHLGEPAFRLGWFENRWRIVGRAWPIVTMAVSTAHRPNSPAEYGFRFDLTGYPAVAPTARPWDLAQDVPLSFERWPAGRHIIPSIFRPDWQNGECLYWPVDRRSMNGHDPWVHQHPNRLWKPDRGIACYLEQLYELLNSSDYTGTRSA